MTTPSTPVQQGFFRSVVKGTTLYTLALFAQRLASLILVPLNTRFLTPTDYGVLELLEQTVLVVSLLLGGHISSALGYFYFEHESDEKRKMVVSTTVIGCTVLGLIGALAGNVSVNPISRAVFGGEGYAPYLILVFLTLPFTFASEALFSWLRVVDRPDLFALGSILRVVVAIASAFLLVAGLKMGVTGVVLTSTISLAVTTILLAIYWLRNVPVSVDRHLFWRMFRFSIPIGIGSVAMMLIHFGDRFILPHYRPLSDLGLYGIAYKLGMLISLLSASFNNFWAAQLFVVVQREDGDYVIGRMFTYVLLGFSFCSLGLTVFCRPVLKVITTPKFEDAALIVPLIVLAYYLRSVGDFFRVFFVVHGRPGFEAICNWVGAGICAIGYVTLIPPFGIWGAGIATAVTFLCWLILAAIWTHRLRPFHFEHVRLAKILITLTATVALHYSIPKHGLVEQLAWGTVVVAAFPLALLALRFPLPAEIERGRALVKKLRSSAGRLGLRT